MDTDDICRPDRFEKQLRVLRERPEVAVVSAWIDEFVDDPGHVVSTRRLPESPEELYEYGRSRCPVNHPVVMFRKQAVLECGGYVHYPLFEDYYLWARMMVGGAKFYNIQESLLWFRTSPDMFRRRGGLRYALTEARLQFLFVGIGYIGLGRFFKNLAVRFADGGAVAVPLRGHRLHRAGAFLQEPGRAFRRSSRAEQPALLGLPPLVAARYGFGLRGKVEKRSKQLL